MKHTLFSLMLAFLSTVSWGQFTLCIVALILVYYLIVAFRYFSEEIRDFWSGNKKAPQPKKMAGKKPDDSLNIIGKSASVEPETPSFKEVLQETGEENGVSEKIIPDGQLFLPFANTYISGANSEMATKSDNLEGNTSVGEENLHLYPEKTQILVSKEIKTQISSIDILDESMSLQESQGILGEIVVVVDDKSAGGVGGNDAAGEPYTDENRSEPDPDEYLLTAEGKMPADMSPEEAFELLNKDPESLTENERKIQAQIRQNSIF